MLRRRGVGGRIPWGSSSEASTWEAWLSKRTRVRRAERVRKRSFLSVRRRGGVVRKGGRVVVAVRHDVWWW